MQAQGRQDLRGCHTGYVSRPMLTSHLIFPGLLRARRPLQTFKADVRDAPFGGAALSRRILGCEWQSEGQG